MSTSHELSFINQTDSWTHAEEGDRSKVYLHPGQMHFSTDPCAITTILGSCVAVCIWDSRLRQGGVVHFVFPGDDGTPGSSLKYAVEAVRAILEKALTFGKRENLVAKLIGGSCMFQAFKQGTQLGARNVEVARELLNSAGVRIAGEHVGGERGRKVIFHTDNGEVWVKSL